MAERTRWVINWYYLGEKMPILIGGKEVGYRQRRDAHIDVIEAADQIGALNLLAMRSDETNETKHIIGEWAMEEQRFMSLIDDLLKQRRQQEVNEGRTYDLEKRLLSITVGTIVIDVVFLLAIIFSFSF